MNRKLLRSLREYKKESILTPILVIFEVFMEVPDSLADGQYHRCRIANSDMNYILKTGLFLILLAVVALFFGAMAGKMGAIASSGYVKKFASGYFLQNPGFFI